jgi:Asp/Glu/hydantoin racemase
VRLYRNKAGPGRNLREAGMPESILVINPNSSDAVTRGIDAACEPLRIPGGPAIRCVTLKEGPPGIETQRDVDGVIGPLVRTVSEHEKDFGAFVIACYSDPGIHSVRELTKKPVLGIAECGILTALTLGEKFGVIAILRRSIARHLRYIGALGVSGRLAAELAIELGVSELTDEKRTFERMKHTGEQLRDDHGANVVVMGCAGMAPYRKKLQDALGIPVVEPTQAAVAMAIGRVKLGWHVA